MAGPSEYDENLWRLTWAPALWLLHLLTCYVTVAVWCGRVVGREGSLETARWLALGYTVAASVPIGWLAARAWRHFYGPGHQESPNEFDTRQSRHRFLSFAELLLAALSLLGVIYVSLPFGFLSTCH